eukprot:jgi/Mesen1/4812/ME000243S03987
MYNFNFPLTLTAIHFVICFVGAYFTIRVLQVKPIAKVTVRDLLVRVLPMAVVTNLNVCLGNVSLRYIPRICQGKHFDSRIYVALVPVVGGVTLASATELSFHLVGFLAALVATIFTSANSILAEVVLKGHVEMDSMNTVYYMAPQIVFMLAPLALATEAADVVRWHYNNTADHSQVWLLVLVSGFLAFGLNFSLFYAIQATSAMTFNVAGNLKVAVAMLLGWMIFRNPMSMWSSLGCGMTVAGCTWYGYIVHKVRQEQQEQQDFLHLRSPTPSSANIKDSVVGSLHSPRAGRQMSSRTTEGDSGGNSSPFQDD